MRSFWNKRRIIYGLVIFVSVLFVFFFWKTFNNEKMQREWIFSRDSVTNFRKWLDISWGTRLTYRISYDNYEQTYSGNTQALAEIKSTV